MALVKAKELRELSRDELRGRHERLQKEFFDLVQKREVGQLDRPHRFRLIRREIAQILTVMSGKAQAPAAPKKETKAVEKKTGKKVKQ